jgi:branched-chain amino acid transport system ATP-binding protein
MLEVRGLSAGYGGLRALWEVDLSVGAGEWVALLGPAGAGKTTLMRSIAGALVPTQGSVRLDGTDVTELPAHRRVRLGLSLVPEGRRLFSGMTVAENLSAGAFTVRSSAMTAQRLERVFDLFPVLLDRRKQQVGTLSGGEQQMCAIARALMTGPRLLLVDELSLGLAPLLVDRLFEALIAIRAEGTTLLIVEQDASTALTHADRGYVMTRGRIVQQGPGEELLADPGFKEALLGH